jgi:hypothetical protein
MRTCSFDPEPPQRIEGIKDMGIRKTRSALYRAARVLGDVQAVEKSIKTGSPAPVTKRYVRKVAYRKVNGALAGLLRGWLR